MINIESGSTITYIPYVGSEVILSNLEIKFFYLNEDLEIIIDNVSIVGKYLELTLDGTQFEYGNGEYTIIDSDYPDNIVDGIWNKKYESEVFYKSINYNN